jgi:hypothetical protein
MELILKGLLLAGALISAWAAYKVIHEYIIENRKGTPSEPEAPYKVEPADTAPDVAVSSNPKRPYTKRSKYWTDKRKKAVAAKARSKTKLK